MTKFTEQFHTKGQEIRMSDAERSRVYSALQAKMAEGSAVASPYWSPFFSRGLAALGLVLFISGGTAYAAEGALPGDLLYPVKVGAVEPVEGALAFSDEAKAGWNARVATARLDEAQALAEKGALTAATSDELAASFNEHATGVIAAANSISAADPASGSDIRARFSSSVAVRGTAILAAGKRSANASSAAVSGKLVVAIATDEDSENAPAKESAPAAMMAKVGFTTALTPTDAAKAARLSEDAHSALKAATTTIATLGLSKDARAEANARAAQIWNRIVKADAELSIGSSDEAAADFSRALRDIDALTAGLDIDSGSTSVNPSNYSVLHNLPSSPSFAIPEHK
jgi:hypothetical protein